GISRGRVASVASGTGASAGARRPRSRRATKAATTSRTMRTNSIPACLHASGRPWHARRVTDRGNGEDPFPVNPVQRRAPLRLVPIDEEAPLLESVKKLASHVLAL